ncbi:MAG: glutamine synthetase [Balneola sp.]|nr:glutamine synthetase [Balneola sp.]MBO6650693.1 glutamine synthetase [Balneola sp.]MBO6710605.1 glutamine synthetase [Balneola sp.]MBO6799291.1 glutamine synthetase [Balneola sp.]
MKFKDLNKEDIIKSVKKAENQSIKFAVTDIDGVLRGKLISKEKFFDSLEKGIGFCNVIFGWDINDATYSNTKVSGWDTGYPDAIAKIDESTYRTIPWDDYKPFFLADFEHSQELMGVCPRTLLKRIIKQCNDLEYLPKFSNEFEWFNFVESPHTLQQKNYTDPVPLTPGMFGYSILRSSQYNYFADRLFESLYEFGIQIEGLHTETGPGVYEASIKYDNILSAADKAVLFKSSVKEIAYQEGIMASFMAKWNKELPGCSGHIHQSLWDTKNETNLFFDNSSQNKMSSLMESYIAGQLYCLPHILPMFAPTVNSYKRFVEGSWAPTAVSFGIDNRTTALRVINSSETAMRLENRVPGSDANPYLSMSASLASGLYGIKNNLKLHISPTAGNEYENIGTEPLATNLHKATKAMKESNIAKELFGETFTDHFIRTREWEWKQYDPQQANWELKRYFEIV